MFNWIAQLMGFNKPAGDQPNSPAQNDPAKSITDIGMGLVGGVIDFIKPLIIPVITLITGVSIFSPEMRNNIGEMLGGLFNKVKGMFGMETDEPKSSFQNSATEVSYKQTERTQVKPEITNDNSKPNSAILNDKGELVAGNKPNEKVDPLSTVKTMTYYTVLEKIKNGELPKNFVEKNDELFKVMLSSSDNDAAKEIARRAGGSRGAEGFIADMNKLAKDKGLNNTAFTNASGEPEAGMFSTAADMAKWQFLLVKDFPKESMKYSATEKVATAKNAGITKDDCQTYKTGTGEGFHGVCNQGNRVGGRSGVGTVDVNRDGIADGAFAIAEVKTGESADYTAIAKKIAATSKGLSHSDVGSADMNRFPPQETPPSKDILQVAKAAK